MDEEQRYLFDTRGVFTIPGALSPGQVRELNRIFDEVEREQDGRMAGDALHWGAAYRELLDLPHISPILEELIGNRREDRVSEAAAKGGIPTFRIDHINVHNRCKGATRTSRRCTTAPASTAGGSATPATTAAAAHSSSGAGPCLGSAAARP